MFFVVIKLTEKMFSKRNLIDLSIKVNKVSLLLDTLLTVLFTALFFV